MPLKRSYTLPVLLGVLAAIACSPSGEGVDGAGASAGTGGAAGSAGSSAGDAGSSGSSGAGGSSASGGTAGTGNVGGGVDLPPGTDPPSLLPAGVRRLTNAEFEASVRALLGVGLPPDTIFPPDARQDGFTRNDAQRVDPVFAKQVAAVAEVLGANAKSRVDELAPCADDPPGEACAQTFIETFGAKAYRRELTGDEVSGLLDVYRIGVTEGTSYADGIGLVVEALIQSTGFLYETEIGDGMVLSPIILAPHELASSLSYLITGQPPDDELMEAARSGALATPEGREQQAWRLLQTGAAARTTILRIVREWLGIDRVSETAKDTTVYPQFEALRPSMASEAESFIAEVVSASEGTVGELLGANWTVADEPLAAFYGASGSGRVSLAGTGRRGILNQGAFLSVYAHASESAPVFRGVAVLRRLACTDPGSPTDLNIDVVPPAPDPNLTTRDRFAQHVADPACAGCHSMIDGIGFTFENFDGMGASREGFENEQAVDTATVVDLGLDFDGSYANSDELALALSQSAAVRACFARHLFHAMTGASAAAVLPSEESFVTIWRADAAAESGKIIDSILAYVRSPLFAYRRAE